MVEISIIGAFFPPEEGMSTIQILMLISGIVIIVLVWLRLRSKLKAQIDEQGGRRPRHSRTREEITRLDSAARNVAIEIEDLSRQVSAKLGTKMRVLDSLLQEADDKIANLEGLLGKERPSGSPDAIPKVPAGIQTAEDKKTGQARPEKEPLHEDETIARIYGLADGGEDSLEISKTTGLPRGEVDLILSLRTRKGR